MRSIDEEDEYGYPMWREDILIFGVGSTLAQVRRCSERIKKSRSPEILARIIERRLRYGLEA